MRAAIYDPDDYQTIYGIKEALGHALDCAECTANFTTPEGVAKLHVVYEYLNKVTSEPVDTPEDALVFCVCWLEIHEMIDKVNTLMGLVDTDAKPN